MKQIIYLGGKKARNYTAPHEETDVIGDCDWKEGEVKTEGVDYFEHPWGINAIVTPVPTPQEKQEGEEETVGQAKERFFQETHVINSQNSRVFEWLETRYKLTRKS